MSNTASTSARSTVIAMRGDSKTSRLHGNAIQFLGVGRRNGYVGARLGERQGDAAADASAGARDQRPATRKRKLFLHG